MIVHWSVFSHWMAKKTREEWQAQLNSFKQGPLFRGVVFGAVEMVVGAAEGNVVLFLTTTLSTRGVGWASSIKVHSAPGGSHCLAGEVEVYYSLFRAWCRGRRNTDFLCC